MTNSRSRSMHAYLDTNALLEFRHPRDNDWCELVGAAEVVLVLTDVVIEELQKIKDGAGRDYPPKKRQRAGELLKSLEHALFSDPSSPDPRTQLRQNVTLIFEYNAVPESVFQQHHLDPKMGDDRLVAALIDGVRRHGTACLVGDDAGPRWKAKAQRILAFELPTSWRIADESDPKDEEIKKLRRQVEKFEKRMPRLSVRFASGETVSHRAVALLRTTDKRAIQAELDALRAAFELKDPSEDEEYQVLIDGEIRIYGGDYAASLEAFLTAAEPLIPDAIAAQNVLDRCIPIDDLLVENYGTAPAEAVRLILRAPSGIRLMEHRPLGYRGKRIPPPVRPGESTLASSLQWVRSRAHEHSELERRLRAISNQRTSWTTSETGSTSNTASIALGTVRHSCQQEKLVPLYVLLPEDHGHRSFAFEYELHAHNLPEPQVGRLHCHLSITEERARLPIITSTEP